MSRRLLAIACVLLLLAGGASAETPSPEAMNEAFYAQPAGQKLLAQSDALAQASAQIGQDISQKAADELKRRLIEGLRQKGHKL